jgi:hypothetical protein
MRWISLVILVCLLTGVTGSHHEPGGLVLETSDTELQKAFDWAKRQALAYAFTDDPVGIWYEAALPGREAFCMRDVSHQSKGAHALGLSRHTKNMLRKFAENISDAKDWCTYWEIDRYGRPPRVDYRNDDEFWYNLPANFDVIDCCYRMYTWTGDRTYIDDPVFQNFYRRTVYDYVARWDLGLDRVMNRRRIMNTTGPLDPKNRFQTNRGIPSYDEGVPDFVVAVDQLAAQYAGYLAYARIQQLRDDDVEAERFLSRANELKSFLNRDWWDAGDGSYYTHLKSDGGLVHQGFSRYIPYYGAAEDGPKLRAVLDVLTRAAAEKTDMGVEGLSHLPEILYRHGRAEPAYDVLLDLTRNERRAYPEVSFSVVGAVATGLMGIELEVHTPDESIEWGGYVDRVLTTLPRLTETTSWAELKHLPVRANNISVRHEGVTKTTLTNHEGPSLLWKARFPGSSDTLLVNGEPVPATNDELYSGGPRISWVQITVGAGETLTAKASN